MAYRAIGESSEYGSVTVGETATELKVGDDTLSGRTGLMIHNTDGTDDIYIGDEDVTTENGYPVPAGESLYLELETGIPVYAICANGNGSVDVRIIEIQ